MKNKLRLVAVLLATVLLSVSFLTGCGNNSIENIEQKEVIEEDKEGTPAAEETGMVEEASQPPVNTSTSTAPTAEDARAYVKAFLDLICIGDYDHSINMIDIDPGEESEIIDEGLATVASNMGMSEELQGDFIAVLKAAFSKCKYTVGDAAPTEDGGYDVTVFIEPLKVYSISEEKMTEKFSEKSACLNVNNMSDEDKNNLVYSILIEIIQDNLKEPTYGETQEVVVHYGLLDETNNIYGLSEEEGTKLADALISYDMD